MSAPNENDPARALQPSVTAGLPSSPMPPSTTSGTMASDPGSEKHASVGQSTAETSGPAPSVRMASTPASASGPLPLMPRSCVVCRSRKVRCSRESPCSNCRRANIPCIFPSNDRPPRWVRRLDRNSGLGATIAAASAAAAAAGGDVQAVVPGPAAQVMDRVKNLESLVKELRTQLDQANAATAAASSASGSGTSVGGSSTTKTSPAASPRADASPLPGVQEQFGRLVVSDDKHSLYVSSRFWSRVNDELDGLKIETQGLAAEEFDSSDEEVSPDKSVSTSEYDRTPAERHAFIFGHNLNPAAPNPQQFQPLPYQVSFLVDIYAEHVNTIAQVVHMPTIRKMVRGLREMGHADLSPANQALLFSIYYAAVTAMEDDDILTNFGSSKSELSLKYRMGLEHALAKANFLHVSDLVLVQALVNFLLVGRRHDSPSFIWMMTGLAIRMAQALGLQRDGSNFEHLTPYEVEIRRRVWWGLCVLDVRSSEDQRIDLTIRPNSFDTKLPLNINDADIDPASTQAPVEREGITDMTFAHISFEICEITRRLMLLNTTDNASNVEEQSKLLEEMHESIQRSYLQHATEPGNIIYWAWIAVVRITAGKLKLITHLPALFASPHEHSSEELRNTLVVTAIEVAEHNHAISAEPRCRQWRWVLQTYTQWHAIVFLLMEMTRRPWSPMIERAWIALQSPWLIPTHQFNVDKHLRVWVPLRKLMAKARMRREAEILRLRGDSLAALQLEAADSKFSAPLPAGPMSAEDATVMFQDKWRKLVGLPQSNETQPTNNPQMQTFQQGSLNYEVPPHQQSNMLGIQDMSSSAGGYVAAHTMGGLPMADPTSFQASMPQFTLSEPPTTQGMPVAFSSDFAGHITSAPVHGSGVLDWLWADPNQSAMFTNVDMTALDVNMDLENEVDWSRWVESAQGMEMDG